MDHARQGGEQGVEWSSVAGQEAADELGALAPATIRADGDGELGARESVGVHAGMAAHTGRARHHVGIALREDDHVAGFEAQGRLADQAAPARAGRQDVIVDDVLGAGHDVRRDLQRGRRLGDPGG